ncbi:PEGA domain-containing protein [Candidatus Dependentiae bacterium]|nr:PEGA domain-containing protein [Candidatus Dependentiae bacterium]
MKKCKICGFENVNESNFCGKCGEKLIQKTKPKSPPIPPSQPAAPPAQEKDTSPTTSSTPPRKRGSNTVLKVVLIVIFSIVGLCIISFFSLLYYESLDGGFNIYSKPEGATVYIRRGSPTYQTPARIRGLKKNRTYTVSVTKSGYKTIKQKIKATVFPKTYNFILEEAKGSVYFVTGVEGYTVFLDNKNTGKITPCKIEDIKVGKYKFRLEKPEQKTITGTIEIVEGKTSQFNTVSGSNVFYNELPDNINKNKTRYEIKIIKVPESRMSYDSFSNLEGDIQEIYNKDFEHNDYRMSSNVELGTYFKKLKKGSRINLIGNVIIETKTDEDFSLKGKLKIVLIHSSTNQLITTQEKGINIEKTSTELSESLTFSESIKIRTKIKDEYKIIIQLFWNNVLINESITPILISPLRMKKFDIIYKGTKIRYLKWGEVNYVHVIFKKKPSVYNSEFIFTIYRKDKISNNSNALYYKCHFREILDARSQGEFHYIIPFIPQKSKKHKSEGYLFDVFFDGYKSYSSKLYP